MSKDTAHYRRARAHALMRAKERYGVDLTHENYRWFCNRLRNQTATMVGLQDDGTEFWIFRWKHRYRFVLAYRRDINAIVTFLPPLAKVVVDAKPKRVA